MLFRASRNPGWQEKKCPIEREPWFRVRRVEKREGSSFSPEGFFRLLSGAFAFIHYGPWEAGVTVHRVLACGVPYVALPDNYNLCEFYTAPADLPGFMNNPDLYDARREYFARFFSLEAVTDTYLMAVV